MIKLLKKQIRGIEDFGDSKLRRIGSIYNNDISIEGIVGKWLVKNLVHFHQQKIIEDINYRAVKRLEERKRVFTHVNSGLNRGIIIIEYNRALEEISNSKKEKARISALHGIAVGIILKKSFVKEGLITLSFAEIIKNKVNEYERLEQYNRIKINNLEVSKSKIILDVGWEKKNFNILPLYEINREVLEIKYGVDLYTFKKPDYFVR